LPWSFPCLCEPLSGDHDATCGDRVRDLPRTPSRVDAEGDWSL
jgi:hypothetical protein